MNYDLSLDIQSSSATVWATWMDLSHWAEWARSFSAIERLDEGPLSKGSHLRIRQPKLPASVWEVAELAPERRLAWQNTRFGVTTFADHRISLSGTGGVRVTLSLRQSGPLAGVLGWLTSGLIRRYVQMEALDLRARCEGKRG